MTDETSAQEAAVDAMAEAVLGDEHWAYAFSELGSDQARDFMAFILDALLSPTKKPCAKCGEHEHNWRFDGDILCKCGERRDATSGRVIHRGCPSPDCTDGFVSSPAPIEGLLEQVGWICAWDDADESITWLGAMNSPDYRNITTTARVFRLPSKVSDE